eukprot:513280-Prymnesium_polylepis.1
MRARDIGASTCSVSEATRMLAPGSDPLPTATLMGFRAMASRHRTGSGPSPTVFSSSHHIAPLHQP